MKAWCDRNLSICSLYFGLCITEAAFHTELRHLNLPREDWPKFLSTKRANATTNFFEKGDGSHCAIVCMHPPGGTVDGIQIAALLVHEAVHIWQRHCNAIGEDNPSIEYEAYGIQAISQELMNKYLELSRSKTKAVRNRKGKT